MATITADQIHALYGEFDNKGRKKLKNLSEVGEYKKLRTDVKDLTDDQLKDLFLKYSKVSDAFSNDMIKEDINAIFSEPGQIAELREMLEENQGDVEYILHGYKKLGKVKKIEKEIEKLEAQINEIKLKLYCEKKSLQTADRVIISRVQKIERDIQNKKEEKEKLMQTKEIVAAYELQKLAGYADRLNNGKLVYTPSVNESRNAVRDRVLTGQNVLLTGPVGTGKTRLAIDIYKEILEEKRKNKEIDDEAYQKLSQLCIVNGNEDSSIRELKSRPIQMSNKEGEENVFTYDEGFLTLCLKYGMPLIIDEANRTPPNFLSSLKKFRALKAGQDYKDEITGETFKIKAPLQVILTGNEGQKYGKHTTDFQDQIERELERVYVGYMPENELFDLAKAKLYETPGIANVTERDLKETLPQFINAVTEINQLYTSGKEFSSSESTTDMRLSSTVIDTKRFLQMIDREIIGTCDTFWDELNQKIVGFIQGIKPSDAGDMDRKILCNIFHAKGLLCRENIPDLIKGADKLTAHDLSTIVPSTRAQLRIPSGIRFVNPWQFATGYGNLINREGDVTRHRLANFEDLDFEDNGTKLKNLSKSLRGLKVLDPLDDRDKELNSQLNSLNVDTLQDVLESFGHKIISKNSEKVAEYGEILKVADEIIPGLGNVVRENLSS